MVKTKQMLNKEQDRIEKVKRARENAIQIAMEKNAKLILKERKYASNTQRHKKMVEEEDEYRLEKFYSIN